MNVKWGEMSATREGQSFYQWIENDIIRGSEKKQATIEIKDVKLKKNETNFNKG